MGVDRQGLTCFMADTFINSGGKDLSPQNFVKLLRAYPDVGRVIYKQSRSPATPDMKYLRSTVLHMLASGLIYLTISKTNPKATCSLTIVTTNRSPSYMNDCYWTHMYLL